VNDLVRVRATDLLARIPTPAGPGARLVAKALRDAGLEPVGVRLGARPVAVVRPCAPELRAAALRSFHGRFRGGTPVLTPGEYVVWALAAGGGAADWGELPATAAPDDVTARRRTLRRASGLLLHDIPAALVRIGRRPGARSDATAAVLRLRALLERVASPAGFPPLPGRDARARELHRTAMGAAHVAFAGAAMEEPGPSFAAAAVAEAPARTARAVASLFAPLVADLGGPTREALRSLVLLPGAVGTRHAWTLLATVDDDAPLHRAAAVRDALQGHLAMLERPVAACVAPLAPVVVTASTLHGMIAGRLFRRPLRRLAARLHRIVLSGPDPVGDPPGLDASDADRRAEVAALLGASATAWTLSARAVDVEDLVFGAWPAAIHHAGWGDPHASQASILAALARRTDPALARVGSGASRRPWGDPEAVDRGRARGFLRDWGPALVRLQEVAVESLR